jgi:hypothetical protein
MNPNVDFSKLTPADRIAGDDETESAQLRDMLARAEKYLRSYRWCPEISERYLAFGVGGVIALFLFVFETPANGTDESLWVVDGDLPSAYFVTDQARDAPSALGVYCELMEQWIAAVESGKSVNGLFPVQVPPTTENADLLRRRIGFIRGRLLPDLKGES